MLLNTASQKIKYNFSTIAIRALNSCRLVHPPSYVGLRMFLGSLPKRKPSMLGESIINRMLRFNTTWRYNDFKVFKKFNEDGIPQYRDFLFGSPTTVLCEAAILDYLSKQKAFQMHPCTYSYEWPKHTKQGRNYNFFLKGYKDRNDKISQYLRNHPQKVAVVTDIEKYYPSVSIETINRKFHKRLESIDNKTMRNVASTFCNSLLYNRSNGIPVGPDFGHFLGQIALEDVDAKMLSLFGDCYTRYVDDIIVVCDRGDVERVKGILTDALDILGLKINHDKTDVVESEVWNKSSPKIQHSREAINFEGLLQDIIKFLCKFPEKYDVLVQSFKNAGFSMPFKRLRALSEYNRCVLFLQRFNPIYAMSQKGLVNKAIKVKHSYLVRLKQIRQQQMPRGLTSKRWYIQKCRYYINRLLYLLDISEYEQLLSLIPMEDEFRQVREVTKSLTESNVSRLMPMPGPTITAFSELWTGISDESPALEVEKPITDEFLDSYSTLLLYRTLGYNPEIQARQSPKTQAFLNFCNGKQPETREFSDLSFIDELRSLQLNYTSDEMHNLLITRYNNNEEFSLAALRLGASSFSL